MVEPAMVDWLGSKKPNTTSLILYDLDTVFQHQNRPRVHPVSIQLLPPNHFFHSPEHSALAGMIRRRSSGPVQLPTVVTGLPVDNSSLASRKNWGWPNQCLEQTERVESPGI